ncbi:MAG: MBL fold metallo-hydrolase [Algicola sp.]|nr:MBL fold metallo-hydrolase [Algicola sp.]
MRNQINRLTLTALLLMSSFVVHCATPDSGVVFNKLTDTLYVTMNNQGANVGMLVGEKAILLIDAGAKRPGNAQALLKGIRKISNKPIKYVLNTHYHFDHTGGNPFFAAMGATIIAQQQMRYSTRPHHLRFKQQFSMSFAGEEISMFHVPGHTKDSAIVFLSKANALFMGDSYSPDMLMYEGVEGKAGYDQMVEKAMSLTNHQSRIIPGHGAISTASDLKRSHEIRDLYRARVGQLYQKGWSAQRIFEDKQTKAILGSGITYYGLRLPQDIIESNFIKAFELTSAQLSRFEGVYVSQDGITTEIFEEDGKLVIRRQGSFLAELRAMSATSFDLVGFPFVQQEEVNFVVSKQGAVEKLVLSIPHRFVLNQWIVAGDAVKKP